MAKRRDDDVSQAQVEAELGELENKLERLRVRYEQFFLGVERTPPSVLRTEVVRLMRKLEQYQLRNTALKFRLRGIIQRFHSYQSYWNRTLREIENGTYRRHRQRAESRQRRRRGPSAAERAKARSKEDQEESKKRVAEVADEASEFLDKLSRGEGKGIDVDYDEFDDEFDDDIDAGFGVRPDTGLKGTIDVFGGGSGGSAGDTSRGGSQKSSAPSATAARQRGGAKPTERRAGRSQRATGSGGGGTTRPQKGRSTPGSTRRAPSKPSVADAHAAHAKRVYDEFVAARERLGMGSSRVSYEKFQRSLDKQAQRVKKTHRCRDVEFRVVVKNGKPFLQPVPKK